LWIAVALALFAEWRDSGKEWRRLKDRRRDSQIRAFGRRAASLLTASRRFGFRRFFRRCFLRVCQRPHVARRGRLTSAKSLALVRQKRQAGGQADGVVSGERTIE
jgi:hypothetical protein